MTLEDFTASINDPKPADNLSPLLKSLWWAKKGNWENAHNIAQEVNTIDGSLVHAYLHRVEGDLWNADYWYSKAQSSRPSHSLEDEWETLAERLL